MTVSAERDVAGVAPDGQDEAAESRASSGRTRPSGNGLGSQHLEGLRNTVEAEVLPRLLRAHGSPGDDTALAPASPAVSGEEIKAFAELLIHARVVEAAAFVEARHQAGVAIDDLYLDLLTPAAQLMGRMWEDDTCSFGDVTVGVCHLRELMRDMGLSFLRDAEPRDPRRRILIATVPGEQHTLGAQMVTDFFLKAGWDARLVAPATREELVSFVRDEAFPVVGLSTACSTRLDTVAACVRAVRKHSRNRGVKVMVGGPIFVAHPDYVTLVGADATATDGRQAPVHAGGLIAYTESPG